MDETEETQVWKLVADDFYEVSNLGNMRRAKPGTATFVGRPVQPAMSPTGYAHVQLCFGQRGKSRRAYVHRLVLEAFVGPCPVGCVVNHIDGNKLNNRLDNLEYVTHKQNVAHAIATIGRRRGPVKPQPPKKGLPTGDQHWTKKKPHLIARAERMPHSKLTPELVTEMRRERESGVALRVLCEKYGISMAQASRVCRGTRWSYVK